MIEAISVADIAGLLAAATQLCVAAGRQIDAISQAPRALSALSDDLEETNSVLETLQGYLDDEETVIGVLHPSTAPDLVVALKDCIQGLCMLEEKLETYTGCRPGAKLGLWKKVKISVRGQEFDEIKRQLAVQNMSFRVSVTVANFINTAYEATPEMQREIGKMKIDVASLLLSLERLHRHRGGRKAAVWTLVRRARLATDVSGKSSGRLSTKLTKSKPPSTTASNAPGEDRPRRPGRRRQSSSVYGIAASESAEGTDAANG